MKKPRLDHQGRIPHEGPHLPEGRVPRRSPPVPVRGFDGSLKLVFIGALLSLLAIVAIVFHLMETLSDTANRQDYTRSARAVEAAMDNERQKLASVLADNAVWSAAVEHAYGRADEQWLADTWGKSTALGSYDIVLLVDAAGRTLWGYARLGRTGLAFEDYAGARAADFVAALPRDGRTFASAIDLFRTGGALRVVGAAPIVREEDSPEPPLAPARFLVLAKTLDAREVAAIAGRIIVSDLHLADAAPADPHWSSSPVRNAAGRTLAFAVWRDMRPGDVVRRAVEWPAFAVVLCLVVSMFWLIHVAWRAGKQLKARERQAKASARLDVLTGLPNRLALLERLGELQAAPASESALLLIDLDGFKSINDAYGHEVGDTLLRQVADAFREMQGAGETLARLGGDEFAMVVAGADAGVRAQRFAQRLIDRLGAAFDLNGRHAMVGASIGLATWPQATDGADELLRRADMAMYEAKRQGRNRLCVYEAALDAERRRKLELARDLRAALAERRIEVVYQPYFDSARRTIAGVEALSRWTHARIGTVAPQDFVAIAEEFGLIDELGRQVLERACRDAAAWPTLKLSVNISPAQFKHPRFVETVLAIVAASGIPPARLELEITETYLIEQQERAQAIIARLNAEGISVALDDFGFGYASLGYLKNYRFGKLKLDKSMVAGTTEGSPAEKMLRAAILIAQSLGLPITAEGVEGEEEAQRLQRLGCDYLQGFMLARPQPAGQIAALLAGDTATA